MRASTIPWVMATTAGLLLCGCSSIVSRYISSQRSYDVGEISTTKQLAELGFMHHQFCSALQTLCISYLTGEPLSERRKLAYQVQIDAGKQREELTLQLDRERLPTTAFHGTVLLLHGFRASKEFMANSALYFRFLGFRVLVPDLLGHGENRGAIGFGLQDSAVLNELLEQIGGNEGPLYVLGNSMGAVAATYLTANRNDVAGLILQAPMVVFDQAVLNYVESYTPILSRLLTTTSIREGAVKALAAAGVQLQQTDLKPLISGLSVPTLLMASSSDPVSPYDYFQGLSAERIRVVRIENRSHPAMSVINQTDSELVLQWLGSISQ